MAGETRFRLPVGGSEVECRWARPRGGDDADNILYLHGFGSSQGGEKAEYFRARAAAAGVGFCTLDFRGHGTSGGEMRGLTLTRCLEDVAAVRRHLATLDGGEITAIAGSSMGGLVGLWHAALEPRGLVAGLYIAPAIGLGEDLARLVGEEGMRQWRQRGAMEVTNELGTFEVGYGLVEDLARYPTRRLAEVHRVPSLIFQGRLDDRVSWRRVVGWVETVGEAATLRLFDEGDHRLLAERDEMWDLMASFLSAGHATMSPDES